MPSLNSCTGAQPVRQHATVSSLCDTDSSRCTLSSLCASLYAPYRRLPALRLAGKSGRPVAGEHFGDCSFATHCFNPVAPSPIGFVSRLLREHACCHISPIALPCLRTGSAPSGRQLTYRPSARLCSSCISRCVVVIMMVRRHTVAMNHHSTWCGIESSRACQTGRCVLRLLMRTAAGS